MLVASPAHDKVILKAEEEAGSCCQSSSGE